MRLFAKRRVVDGVQEKECTHCHTWKAENRAHFYLISGRHHAWCKDCLNGAREVRRAAERPVKHSCVSVTPLDQLTASWGLCGATR